MGERVLYVNTTKSRGEIEMTIDDYIKWANKEIDKNESYIQAADGLPGLYYDAEEVKGYEKNIEHYKQLVEYLEDYKKLKNSIKDIKKKEITT